MSPHPSLTDVALRLVLTLAAGALIGFNRRQRGHAAGLRTTMLVSLAAAVAMVLANTLLATSGKTEHSFATTDVMRLPLGVLSGMGFIGAGSIMRRGDAISGVTTAATLWAVTMIGLCFGAGELGLGGATTALVWLVLCALKRYELMLESEQKASLVLRLATLEPDEASLVSLLRGEGIHAAYIKGAYDAAQGACEVTYELRWRALAGGGSPAVIARLLALPNVRGVSWNGAS